jgi:hypothetical protein
MKPHPASFWLLPILLFLPWFARLGQIFAVIAEVLVVSATVAFLLLLMARPQVQLRKRAVPEPAIRLDIGGPSN